MKKFLTVAALIWVFFLLQTSVCPWIAFGSIKPNLLVILIASIGFMEGSKAGMWTGFACGLLADLFAANGVSLISQNGATGDLLGFYALLFLYVGYLCEPAFLSRRYQASADDDCRCRPLRQFRLLSDYVSDAGAP